MRKQHIYLLLFLGWVSVITVLSLISFEGVSTSNITIPHIDKIVHAAFYFGFTILLFLYVKEKWGYSVKKTLTTSCLVAFCYGIVIEVLQETLTKFRAAELADVLGNIIGILGAAILVKLLFVSRKQLK